MLVTKMESDVSSVATSVLLCGRRVDGQLMMLWVHRSSDSELRVRGFNVLSGEASELTMGPDDWAWTGYGSLPGMGTSAVKDLCAQLCRALRMSADGTGLLLSPAPVSATVPSSPETARPQKEVAGRTPSAQEPPARPGIMLHSQAVRVGGMVILVSISRDESSEDMKVCGLDPASNWYGELIVCEADYAVRGYSAVSGMSLSRVGRVCREICDQLRLDGARTLYLEPFAALAVPEPDKGLQGSVLEEHDAVGGALISGSHGPRQAALVTWGVKLGERWLMLWVEESTTSEGLNIHGFDPADGSSFELFVSGAECAQRLGRGAWAGLSPDAKVNAAGDICRCVRMGPGGGLYFDGAVQSTTAVAARMPHDGPLGSSG